MHRRGLTPVRLPTRFTTVSAQRSARRRGLSSAVIDQRPQWQYCSRLMNRPAAMADLKKASDA